MRDLVLAIVVSVLISAGITYWMVRRSPEPTTASSSAGQAARTAVAAYDRRSDPTLIAVLITPAGGNRCTANTDPYRQSKGAGPIHWIIRRAGNNVNKCFENGEVVKIVPKSGNTSPLTPEQPYDSRLIRAEHGAAPTRYHYQVVMANASGSDLYSMEDPELEIVETFEIKKGQ